MKTIGIIFLVIFCAISIFIALAIFGAYIAKNLQLKKLNLNDPEDFLKAAIICHGPIEEKFSDVTLMILENYSKEKTIIYDLSSLPTKNIIGLYVSCEDASADEDEKINFVFHQEVARFKDGTILWIK